MLVGPLLALNVLSGAVDDKYEIAVYGRIRGGEKQRVWEWDGSAEIIHHEPNANSVIAVVHPYFVANSRIDQLGKTNGSSVNTG